MAVTKAKKIEQVEELGQELQDSFQHDCCHLQQADRGPGFRAAQDAAQHRRQISRGEEHAGGARLQGHQGRKRR